MKKTQWILLIAAFAISIAIYHSFDYVRVEKSTDQVPEGAIVQQEVKESMIKAAFDNLTPEKRAKADSLIKIEDFLSLAAIFEKSNLLDAAVMSYVQAQKSLDKEIDLLFVGKKIVNSLKFLQVPVVKEQGTRVAKSIYDDLVKKDPNNADYQIGLAGCYIEGLNDVMSGVNILKKVIEGEPKNIHANFQLGRLGIVSGQFDKAITRLEVVLEQDPKDIDALLYMAEAYISMNQNNNAVKYLQQAEPLITNVEVKEKINKYIKELIN